jgi:hypothetical protein
VVYFFTSLLLYYCILYFFTSTAFFTSLLLYFFTTAVSYASLCHAIRACLLFSYGYLGNCCCCTTQGGSCRCCCCCHGCGTLGRTFEKKIRLTYDKRRYNHHQEELQQPPGEVARITGWRRTSPWGLNRVSAFFSTHLHFEENFKNSGRESKFRMKSQDIHHIRANREI